MNLPYAWRITKYDPALRNPQGQFLGDDWISLSEIGQIYDGKPLTYEAYLSRENAYVRSVKSFMTEAGLASVRVVGLENRCIGQVKAAQLRDIELRPALLKAKSVVDLSMIEDVARLILREVLWCKLVEKNRFYVHFGYDYYMYS